MYKPIYKITNNLLTFISQIEAARQIIDNAPLIPSWERRFRLDAEERTIYFSTKIEGNKLDFNETKDIIKNESVKTFRRRDIQEIVNYRDVIQFMSKLKNKSIDKKTLLLIHKRIMKNILPSEELGKFRYCEEVLLHSKSYKVVFEPIEPEFIEGEVDNLFYWFQDKAKNVHPVIKAAVLLYEIARIHPFTDGNGRTARILATLSLYLDGYDIKKFFSLEEYYDQNLSEYYKALESVEENGDDLTFWLEFFAKGLSIELERVKNKILDISRDTVLRKNIGQVALNDRQIKIINYIQEYGIISNKNWQNMFPDISDDTILRDLKDLIKKKVVKKKGVTKSAKYILK